MERKERKQGKGKERMRETEETMKNNEQKSQDTHIEENNRKMIFFFKSKKAHL